MTCHVLSPVHMCHVLFCQQYICAMFCQLYMTCNVLPAVHMCHVLFCQLYICSFHVLPAEYDMSCFASSIYVPCVHICHVLSAENDMSCSASCTHVSCFRNQAMLFDVSIIKLLDTFKKNILLDSLKCFVMKNIVRFCVRFLSWAVGIFFPHTVAVQSWILYTGKIKL